MVYRYGHEDGILGGVLDGSGTSNMSVDHYR
jgi:hypothetical protein